MRTDRHAKHGNGIRTFCFALRKGGAFLLGRLGLCTVAVLAIPRASIAETIESALARAYAGNPTLNSTRASVRATDENVPRARAGYLPRVAGTADAGYQYNEAHTPETRRSNRGGDITVSAGGTS